MPHPYLLLWLEAPLQSWGFDSKFGRRDSLGFPTKSGVLGLICCALGAGGRQREFLADFAELDMQVAVFPRCDSEGRPLPREPLLCDFHMVGSGYNTKDPWQNLMIPKTSKGTKAVGGGTKMTFRYYIQDMAFAVIIQVPESRAEVVANHLKNPVWDLYLGRKNCVPTEFIFQGIFAQPNIAMEAAERIAAAKGRVMSLRVLQGEHDDGDVIMLNDVPVQFGKHKVYRDRRITLIPVMPQDDAR